MRPIIAVLPLVVLAACSSQPDTPGGRAATARHGHFHEIGDAFKDVGEELKGPSPSVAQLRVDAATLAALAPQLQTWFPAGSGPQDKVHTDALAAVWTKPAEFQHAAERFTAAATSFDSAAKAGDVAGMKAAAQGLGAACKACHEQFREKD